MSEASKAVFLSYASQDAEAAKRIADALRAAGVEVWFDQSELVGGDAWDQKIRKQIKDCALLIPVVSKTTQGRREAYFRLEWKLADDRTHLMAKGTPFLLPVAIDATNDREAAEIKYRIVPKTTLARRRRLTLEESERLERLARITVLAEDVWENEADAHEFLHSEQYQLGGARPIDLARSDLGAREVEELLMKLEYSLPV